jgi:glycosyltransferase involved in cell wall biosynthesis
MISLVIPVYNNAPALTNLYQRSVGVLRQSEADYEIIFIDDASIDSSFSIIESICQKDSRVKVVRLERNHGQSIATITGLRRAKGSIVVTIDADLQYAPEDIPKLLKKKKEGFALVCGWRKKRKSTFFMRRFASCLANLFIGYRIKKRLKDAGSTFMAIDKILIERIKDHKGIDRFLKPALLKISPNFCEIEVGYFPRAYGRSQYNIVKLVMMTMDFIFNFKV